MRTPVFAHFKESEDYFNLGDTVSCPATYLYPHIETTNLTDLPSPGTDTSPLIVGGGGLLYGAWPDRFAFEAEFRDVILWGAGLNYPFAQGLEHLPDALRKLALVGLRDRKFAQDHGFAWVPCASCLSKLFDTHAPLSREVVIYEHTWVPFPREGLPFPVMSNMSRHIPFRDVIDFLASAQVVITNSYHGAYWAQLMGRHVIIWSPASSPMRFFSGLPQLPVFARSADEVEEILRYSTFPANEKWLDVCRAFNYAFSARVEEVLAKENQ